MVFQRRCGTCNRRSRSRSPTIRAVVAWTVHNTPPTPPDLPVERPTIVCVMAADGLRAVGAIVLASGDTVVASAGQLAAQAEPAIEPARRAAKRRSEDKPQTQEDESNAEQESLASADRVTELLDEGRLQATPTASPAAQVSAAMAAVQHYNHKFNATAAAPIPAPAWSAATIPTRARCSGR